MNEEEYPKMNKRLIDDLTKELSKLDCGSHSCIFAKDKTGMRTNSQCLCLNSLPTGLRIILQKIYYFNNN